MAQTDRIWITASQLKDGTYIEANVPSEDLVTTIKRVQSIHLKPLLGSAFYYELNTLADGNGSFTGTTSAQHTLLDDYVLPYLKEACFAEWCAFGAYSFHKNGISKSDSENFLSIDREEINQLHEQAKASSEFLATRMITHICDYGNIFTTYGSGTNENPHPKGNTFSSGIYLGKGKSKDRIWCKKNW